MKSSKPSNSHSNSSNKDYRTCARTLALQFLHQLSVQKGAPLDILDYFLEQQNQSSKCTELARQWILGTWHRLGEIDKHIQTVSQNWDINRISIVDRANLRLAVYQLLFCPDIPPKVIINEAIELAKNFSALQAPSFINGILDAVLKTKKTQ